MQRVYGPWLGNGLLRAHVGKLDPELGVAIRNWLRRHPWPEDVDLPSQKGNQDALTNIVLSGDTITVTISHPDAAARAKAIRNLGEKLRYEDKRSGTPSR